MCPKLLKCLIESPSVYAGLGGFKGVRLKLYDSQQMLEVRLKDSYGALKRFEGQKLVLTGHSKDPATQLPVCFSAVVKVCDTRFSS